jgi:tryptophan synthase alpha chain
MSTAVQTGRARAAFDAAREDDRALLVAYLPAGFPTIDTCARAARALVDAGVDVVEIGLPYSDPVMDGPVIQQAVDKALAQGIRISDVIATAGQVAQSGAPTLVMTYWNPVERYGVDRFAADLAEAGGAGTITPDLTPEESSSWVAASQAAGLDTVFLVAPSSPDARIDLVEGITTGFVYAASTMGVTGTRTQVSSRAAELVARVRARTQSPVAVGLGVSTPAQAAEVAAYADGVIVGSAFVQRLLDAGDDIEAGIASAAQLAGELAGAVRGARR